MHRGESFCPMSRSISYEKGRKCDVRFLSSSRIELSEWEFSTHCTNAKAIGDRCRSSRVNQSILNAILRLNLTKEQVKKTKIPFLQISGVYGQMLLLDLINGFYVVFLGATFEIPTKLAHIKKLKSTVKIFKYATVSIIIMEY